jgi:topoisomerase-4 subunit A
MSEENEEQNLDADPNELNQKEEGSITPVSGMFKDWFLDYASYVILERAVPALMDGLKPVQRRILHSMFELEDGRYNKVANLIGNTMKYHPHGDTSIGDALVQVGQKNLLIDMQGNWGNTLTGDRAAASRYIEARLTKFALEVVFNKKTTNWLASYDGRNKEPEFLPVKFPLLLAQGAEGIAVGLACKILPHNFIELINASIDILKGKSPKVYPDFIQGGQADFSQYNDGLRGGRIRVRARIRQEDKKTLIVHEIPFGTTTSSVIDSIIKANDKGKIKIKKIEDNTAEHVEIMIHLPAGISPDKTIDALFAFTDCEVSISPNAAVIIDDKPRFAGVSEILKFSTDQTLALLKKELEIKKGELEESWHFASLEKIFIENRIYRDIEEEETWEGVIQAIDKGLKPHVKHLKRKITEEDIIRLTEIKIKRISKFDAFKADEIIRKLEEELEKVEFHLNNLVDYAIDYFKNLKEKYGEGKERKTEIKIFDTIQANKVIVANKKLYVNYKEGFIGWSLKKDEFIADCSEIDDVIVFTKDGRMMVTKVADKKFVAKEIIYAGLWKKGDKRTIYHMIYQDGKGGATFVKRFAVKSITRDKFYPMTKGKAGSTVHYLSVHPNGEREVVTIHLRPRNHLKKLRWEIDFSELLIKGRASMGNKVTKELVSKVVQKEVGISTLAARKIWFDEVVGRLNDEGRGELLGSFKGGDKILTLYSEGMYRLSNFDLGNRFDDGLIHIEKWNPDHPITTVYYDPEKELHYVKRFLCEVTSDKMVSFISEGEGAYMDVVSTDFNPIISISYSKRYKETKHLKDKVIELKDFIDVKGMKILGNQLTKLPVKDIALLPSKPEDAWEVIEEDLEDAVEENEVEENEEKEEVVEKAEREEKEITKEVKAENEGDLIEMDDSEKTESIEFEIVTPVEGKKKSPKKSSEPKKKKIVKPIEDDDEEQMKLF